MKSLIIILFILTNTSLANDIIDITSECGNRKYVGITYEDLGNIKALSEFNFSQHDTNKIIRSLPGDDRKVRNNSSPKWLEAVGKLKVKGNGNCTAELVKNEDDKASKVVITNYHCINKVLRKGDLSDIAQITFRNNKGQEVKTKVSYIFDHGGSLNKDYAILILDDYIPTSLINALVPNDENVLTLREDIKDTDTFDILAQQTYKETAAGFSADVDAHLGNKGLNLTYDDTCYAYDHTGRESSDSFDDDEISKFRSSKNCHVYPGSSGGAYVITYKDKFDDEIEESIYLHGIISGLYTEKNGHIITVKASVFIDSLYDAMDTYNIPGD